MTKVNRCDQCKYWEKEDSKSNVDRHPDDQMGECHRHAPSPSVNTDFQYEALKFLAVMSWQFADSKEEKKWFNTWENAASDSTVITWPCTSSGGWCGDFAVRSI